MAGLQVGIVGAGGVGIATAGALIMNGLAGRVTLSPEDVMIVTVGDHIQPGETRLDVLTEYRARRGEGQPVSVMGSGTSLDTLRFGERLADVCGVHPRSIHACVIGEHGDSSVFLFSSATIAALPLRDYAAQRGIDLTPAWFARIEDDVRTVAYRVRELKGSPRHGIGLAVSGLVRCSAPLWPVMDAGEREGWECSLDVLRGAGRALPITA